MTPPERGHGGDRRLRLLPAGAAVVVAVGIAVYMTSSPLGSDATSTMGIAAAIAIVPVVSLACLAAGYDDAALCLGAVFFPAGLLAIAVGPQLWIVGALLVLSLTLERTTVAAALLAVIAALLVLTVATLTWFRTVGAVIALVVFAVAAASAHLARSRPDPA